MSSTDLISNVKVCFDVRNLYAEDLLYCYTIILLDVEKCEDDDYLNVTRQITEK